MKETVTHDTRPHPRHGWLAAVIPEGARRFRAHDNELAVTLTVAGAELVETDPDVEIGTLDQLSGDAACAVVEVGVAERQGGMRLVRGGRRIARSLEIAHRAAQARRVLRGLGYSSTDVVTWERGVTLSPYQTAATAPRRIAHRFPLNAVVVGKRHPWQPTQFSAALSAAEAHAGRRLRPEGLVLGASGVIIARSNGVVLRVAIGPAARRIQEQHAALSALRSADPGPIIAERVPWITGYGKAGLAVWSLERRLPGAPPRPSLTDPIVGDALEFLQELHGLGGDGAASDKITQRAESIARLCDDGTASALRALSATLDRSLADVPRGFSHGDFWTGNLLVDGRRLAGVVDWPAASPGSLPTLDLLHLEVNTIREPTGHQVGFVLTQNTLPQLRSGGSELFRSYCARLGLEFDAAQREALVAAYWLQALAHELFDPDRDPNQGEDPNWRRENIQLVLEALTNGTGKVRPTAERRPAKSDAVVEVVTDTPSLEATAGEWRRLAESRGNPFITPEWFFTWLRHFGAGSAPFVPVVRRPDGSFLGLMPLVASSGRRYPIVRFAGADLADYFEPVAASEDEKALAVATAGALAAKRGEWAIFVADYVADDTAFIKTLVDTPGLAKKRYHDHPSVFRSVELTGQTWESYVASLSRNLRGQIGRKLRGLEKEHDVRFRRTVESAELVTDMNRLFALHKLRWSGRGETFLADERARAFHVEFAAEALERQWLRLWSLDVDGETIAAWYGWHIGDRYLYYQAGFDPAWSRHSPGLVLLAHTIRAAIDEGAREYDMLIGDERYKARFTTGVRTAETIVITRPIHPAALVVAVDVGLRRAIRRLPSELHHGIRQKVNPVLRRWPIKTAP
jgi:CelD/BcsL family acetyltransferase involved in cellulose biosynthesis/aminoglycoside phosphotransferase (APT) family kinase protein